MANQAAQKIISLGDRAELVEDAVETMLGLPDPDDMPMLGMEEAESDNDIDDTDMDRCVEVYDTYLVLCTDNAYWQADYTLDETTGGVAIAPRDQWVQVEQLWKPVGGKVARWTPIKSGARHSSGDSKLIQGIHDNAVALGAIPAASIESTWPKSTRAHIKALTDDTATVAGYGVLYGGADLEGESFGPQTDFMLDLAPVKLVLYDHSLGDVKHVIGKTVTVTPDENGLWIEAELDRNKGYVDMVVQLVERGALGWSSGSVGHLTRRSGKSITQWPIIEMSLTPTPAEPRTLGVELIKSWIPLNPDFARLLPEAAKAAVQGDKEGAGTEIDAGELEENEMPEQTEAQVKTAIDTALAPYLKVLEAIPVNGADMQLPMMNTKTKLGDDELKSYMHYIRSGDDGGIRSLKASNNNPMGETTPAQGGYAVPVGMYNQIIAKLRETALYGPLGVQMIPGKGLTVNVPIEGAKDGAFVATGEGSTTDRDSPILGQAAMTLVKYTKRIELSWELMEDEDAQLMNFIANWVGQGMAKTHNSLLVTEATTNGTLGVAWGNPIVAANVPSLIYALPQGYETNAAWVMNKTTEGVIRGFTGNFFQFIPTPVDGPGALSRRELFGYPLYNSASVATPAASAKAALFGNFSYMGMRLAPDITFLRDPYSAANTGQLRLHYYFRTCYKILQAEAILYAQQGT